MRRVKNGKGTRFLLDERVFEITEILLDQKFKAKDLNFGREKMFDLKEINKYLYEGRLRYDEKGKNTVSVVDGISRSRFSDINDLPDERRDEARFRYNAIKPLVDDPVDSMNKAINLRIAELKSEGLNVSRASLYRWVKAWNESNGNYQSLVSNFENCGAKDHKVPKEVDIIIEEFIEKMYKKKERLTMKTVTELIHHEIDIRNSLRTSEHQIPTPSSATIRRRILDHDLSEVTARRYGEKHAFDKHGKVNDFIKPTYPLQRVECDHTRLDLMVVDDEHRLPIGRPTITSLLDVFTGYPLGVYIGFEPPSYTAVMHALKHAVTPKDYVKINYPSVKNEWIAFGLPEMLVCDNGKDFLGKDLEDVCNQLGITKYHCPPKKSWFKGSVERHFRTINQQLLHQSRGTTFSNILDKKDYNPKKNAVVSFSRLLELYHVWLLDYYTESYNKGVRGVPKRLWEATAGNFTPDVPSYMPDLDIILGKSGEGTIQRTGIQYKHLYYKSDVLAQLRNRLLARGGDQAVKFKFDPTDISKMYVFDPIDKEYVEALCSDQKYSKGLSYYTHMVIVAKMRQDAKEVNQKALNATKAKMIELIEQEWKETKTTQRAKLARHKGIGSNKEFIVKKSDETFNRYPSDESLVEEDVAFAGFNATNIEDNNEWGGYYARR